MSLLDENIEEWWVLVIRIHPVQGFVRLLIHLLKRREGILLFNRIGAHSNGIPGELLAAPLLFLWRVHC